MYFHAVDTMDDVPGRLLVNDPYTTMTIAGFNGGNGIWMTRDGLNFNTTPSNGCDWTMLQQEQERRPSSSQ